MDRIKYSFNVRCGLAALIFFMLASAASKTHAQREFQLYDEYDRYRYLPRLPQGHENPAPLPDAPKEATGSPKILVDELKGLVFVDSPDKIVQGMIDTPGLHIDVNSRLGVVNSPAFRKIAESYLGGPVSQLRLNEMIRELILLYRRNDLPVVDISVPEQDVTDGTVQLILREGRTGQVRVRGARYFNNQVLADQLYLGPNQPIYESALQEELRWLYRNPFRTVDMELTPGKNSGETDIYFNIEDNLPIRPYLGYEDTGNQALGLERTFYGINWNNALWQDDYFGYQYTASSDFSSLGAHSGYYSFALHNRDIITVYGSYAHLRSPIAAFNNEGVTWQILTRWYRELCPWGCYEHGITAGIDIKQTNNNLDQGGVTVFNSSADIFQFMAGYVGRRTDSAGSWSIGLDAFLSPGDMMSNNNDAAFQDIRAFADANYAYARGVVERRWWLPKCCEFVVRGVGQLADGNLLPTEQLGLGGYNSIRGYDLFSVVGDSGYFFNMELWSPKYCVRGGELRYLAFFDFGQALNHTLLPAEPSSVDMQGVGLGFRYTIDPKLSIRCDYGWQLTRIPALQQPESRVHLGIVLAY